MILTGNTIFITGGGSGIGCGLAEALHKRGNQQPAATIIYNTSVLGYVPLAATAVYSATKSALHSYVLSQRFKLRGTAVKVLELAPPWVRTDLMNSREAEAAMPHDEFIQGAMTQLGTNAEEILVGNASLFRRNPGPDEGAFVTEFNASLPF